MWASQRRVTPAQARPAHPQRIRIPAGASPTASDVAPGRPGGSRGSLPRASCAIAPRWLGAYGAISASGDVACRGLGASPRPHHALPDQHGQREAPGAHTFAAPRELGGRAERLHGSVENFCLDNPIAKGCQVPAANYLGRTRPGPGGHRAGQQPPARHASAGTAGRMATSPGSHRRPQAQEQCHTPLFSSGTARCGVRITHAGMPGFLRCNAMLAVAWWCGEWADCTAIAADVCAPHKAGHHERRRFGAGFTLPWCRQLSGRAGAGPPRRPFPRCPAWSIPRPRPGRPRSAGRGPIRHRYRGVL